MILHCVLTVRMGQQPPKFTQGQPDQGTQVPQSPYRTLTPLLFFLACIRDVVVGDTDLETWLERKERGSFLAAEQPLLHTCSSHV